MNIVMRHKGDGSSQFWRLCNCLVLCEVVQGLIDSMCAYMYSVLTKVVCV